MSGPAPKNWASAPGKGRWDEPQGAPLLADLDGSDPQALLVNLLENVADYDRESRTKIRLVPTEGLMSPLQKLMFLSVQTGRYLHAPPEDDLKAIRYPDIHNLQVTYEICRSAAREALQARYCIPDYLSGLQAMTLSLLAFTAAGDVVASVDPADGGHPSTRRIVERLGRQSAFLSFDSMAAPEGEQSLSGTPPALVYLDYSNLLHAPDLHAIRESVPDATLVVDASQVLGLVVSGAFPNPLANGADALVASTHKSLCGPQKALLATNSADLYNQAQQVCGEFISNNHPADVGALAVCLLEAKVVGQKYGQQLIANARTLAHALQERNWPIYSSPYAEGSVTDTHQVWVDCSRQEWVAEDTVQLLNSAGIVVNTLFIGGDSQAGTGSKGLRLGTTEVTRLGMAEPEMTAIANMMSDVVDGRMSPQEVRGRAATLRSTFREPTHCVTFDAVRAPVRLSLRDLLRPFDGLFELEEE
jgi:glycine hydroxymethyltransferase